MLLPNSELLAREHYPTFTAFQEVAARLRSAVAVLPSVQGYFWWKDIVYMTIDGVQASVERGIFNLRRSSYESVPKSSKGVANKKLKANGSTDPHLRTTKFVGNEKALVRVSRGFYTA